MSDKCKKKGKKCSERQKKKAGNLSAAVLCTVKKKIVKIRNHAFTVHMSAVIVRMLSLFHKIVTIPGSAAWCKDPMCDRSFQSSDAQMLTEETF